MSNFFLWFVHDLAVFLWFEVTEPYTTEVGFYFVDSVVVVLNGSQTSYRVKNLSGGKNYKITVTAGFKGGNSPPAQFPFTAYRVLFTDEPDREGMFFEISNT